MAYNGKVTNRKSGEPLVGIPVSDGRNIVFTDSEGCFSLEGWERAKIIHVGVLTRRHNDWYIMINGHEGDYDFMIDKIDAPTDFCFLHTSDTEIENRPYADFVSFMKDEVEKNSAAFFVHTGDLCREDGLKRHYLAMNRETVGCPVRYVIGNHDFIGYNYGEEMYEKLYGPTWYSFDCGNIHFVALAIGYGDNPSGYELCDQWIWLEKDLANVPKDKKVIVLDHTLCYDENGFRPTVGDMKIDIRSKGLAAWIFGHYHTNYTNNMDGVLNICTSRPDSGGIDSSPAGIRKISICGTEVSTEMIFYRPEVEGEKSDYVWETKLCGHIEFSTPVVCDGFVYVGTCDDGFPKQCGIYKLSEKDGSIGWFFKTTNSVKGDVALCDGCVYAQDSEGTLYCIDAGDGKLLWSVDSEFITNRFTRLAPVIFEDIVFAGSSSRIFAYNRKTGKYIYDTVIKHCDASPAKLVVDKENRHLLVSLQWAYLACLDIDSGKLLWQNGENRLRFRSSTPLLQEGMIYSGGMCDLSKLDAKTGETLATEYSRSRIDVSGAPVISGNIVYYPTGDKGVLGFDKENFKLLLTFPSGVSKLYTSPYIHGNISTVEGSPVIVGDELIFAGSDGYIHIYDKNTACEKKNICIGAPSSVSPIVTNDGIITADFDGYVTKFNK